MTEDCPVEIRAAEDEHATLGDIFVAGQPLGPLLDKAREETKALRQENETLKDRLAELEASHERLQERVDTAESAWHSSGKQGKVRALVEHAENRRSGGEDVVLLGYKEIAGAAGVSKKYAYNIIDEWPDEYAFFSRRSELKQYGEAQIDSTNREKALAVLVEQVPREDGRLNLFNNGVGSEGGEA